jgi:hypothetical protein
MRFAEDKAAGFCCNWIAVLSYTGALAFSLAIWSGLLRAVGHWMR